MRSISDHFSRKSLGEGSICLFFVKIARCVYTQITWQIMVADNSILIWKGSKDACSDPPHLD